MEEVKVSESKAIEIVAGEPDPRLTENALRVLQKRYLKKDDKGKVIETPRELFARVAWNLAQAERNYGADEARVKETGRRNRFCIFTPAAEGRFCEVHDGRRLWPRIVHEDL